MGNEMYILLVEDNEDDIELTNLAFKKCQVPHELVVVYDGQEALDYLFGQGKYASRDVTQIPAVVLLDLKLPYVTGQEVLKKIRTNPALGRTPVVVLSSSTNTQEIDECEQLKASRYYRKPGSFSEFKKIVTEISDSYLKNEPRD